MAFAKSVLFLSISVFLFLFLAFFTNHYTSHIAHLFVLLLFLLAEQQRLCHWKLAAHDRAHRQDAYAGALVSDPVSGYVGFHSGVPHSSCAL